jgi:exosortase/archaeosortase family protein
MKKKSNRSARQPSRGHTLHVDDRLTKRAELGNRKTGLLRPLRWMMSFSRRRPITTFIGGVIVLMGLFYALYTPSWQFDIIGEYFLPWNLRMHAELSGGALRLLGNEITVSDRSVISPRFSMQIVRGCDALEPTALFLSACLAFPVATFRSKLWGMGVGFLCLEATNIVRLVTLFYVGVYWPKQFEMMHLEVWQALFIVLAVAYWAAWALWASKPPAPSEAIDGDS